MSFVRTAKRLAGLTTSALVALVRARIGGVAVATWLGVAAAWVAAAAAVVFGVIAARQARASGADADRAERAVTETQRVADETARNADETRRIAEALQPPPDVPDWRIEHRDGVFYALRNVGLAVAHSVRIDGGGSLARDLPGPDGVTLNINASHGFVLIDVAQLPFPLELLVSCDELGERSVAVPPR